MGRIPKDLLARLDYFQNKADELFQRLFGPELGTGFTPEDESPCLDLIETKTGYIIIMDLPGVERHELELYVAPNYVLVQGRKRPDAASSDCLRVERAFGEFQRLMPLPAAADIGKVAAKFSQGVLEVRLNKVAERREGQRRVDIA